MGKGKRGKREKMKSYFPFSFAKDSNRKKVSFLRFYYLRYFISKMSLCSFDQCNNVRVPNSEYCHCKRHYPSREAYNAIYEKNVAQFMSDSIDMDDFRVLKTHEDGSCLYHSLVLFMKKHKSVPRIATFFEGKDDTIDDELLCSQLQELLRTWLLDHLEESVPDFGDISVRDMILLFHQPDIETIEEYSQYYAIYAGDSDYIHDGKKKVRIPTRWGSSAELYAFKKIFRVNIIVYNKFKFVKRTMCVSQCSDRETSISEHIFRYRIYNQLMDDANDAYPQVKLLFLAGKNHYHALEDL